MYSVFLLSRKLMMSIVDLCLHWVSACFSLRTHFSHTFFIHINSSKLYKLLYNWVEYLRWKKKRSTWIDSYFLQLFSFAKILVVLWVVSLLRVWKRRLLRSPSLYHQNSEIPFIPMSINSIIVLKPTSNCDAKKLKFSYCSDEQRHSFRKRIFTLVYALKDIHFVWMFTKV